MVSFQTSEETEPWKGPLISTLSRTKIPSGQGFLPPPLAGPKAEMAAGRAPSGSHKAIGCSGKCLHSPHLCFLAGTTVPQAAPCQACFILVLDLRMSSWTTMLQTAGVTRPAWSERHRAGLPRLSSQRRQEFTPSLLHSQASLFLSYPRESANGSPSLCVHGQLKASFHLCKGWQTGLQGQLHTHPNTLQ